MNWKGFLTDISKTVIQNGDLLERFSSNPTNWLGFDGITDAEIELHEKRLNTTLPPSYKEFLKASNGFKQLSGFVWDLLPIDKIEWLKEFDKPFCNVYTEIPFQVSDEEYFIYGDKQRSTNFRSSYLLNSLAISDWGDATILLLNPDVKFGDEWEAWNFAVWQLGPYRYKSFEELIKEDYSSYLQLLSEQ